MKLHALYKRPTVGLALGSGGPKGLAHIGLIKTLLSNNIPIDFVAGTSAGAIVGAFYAKHKDIGKVEEYIMKKNWWDIVSLLADPSLREGILQGRRSQNFIEGFLGPDLQFDELLLPFQAVAVDLGNGKAVGIDRGNVTKAVMASSAIPMVFKPVEIEGAYYVDGGVSSPVPVHTVRKMGADIVIAVNLDAHYACDAFPAKLNFLGVAKNTYEIMMHNIADYEVQQADVVVTPSVDRIFWKSLLEAKDKEKGIRTGSLAMEEQMMSLRVLIKSREPFIYRTLRKIRRAFGG